MSEELSGMVAIVTGGASGIGRGIVERFLAEGAKVVLGDVQDELGAMVADAGGADAHFCHTDVGDQAQVADLVAAAIETFGGLHVMVNNAGRSSPLKKGLFDEDFAEFDSVMRTNVLGVMAGTRDAARHMAEHGGGSIINVSSIGGILAGGGVATYRASKAAVIQFSKSAAIELANYEVRVNCIAPGNIPTPILRSAATGRTARSSRSSRRASARRCATTGRSSARAPRTTSRRRRSTSRRIGRATSPGPSSRSTAARWRGRSCRRGPGVKSIA